ncbi:MAG TPA: hypothetical protein VIH89_03825 [Candidatus Sulfotelmatobacter sp.]|jgi:hypothetical protein
MSRETAVNYYLQTNLAEVKAFPIKVQHTVVTESNVTFGPFVRTHSERPVGEQGAIIVITDFYASGTE